MRRVKTLFLAGLLTATGGAWSETPRVVTPAPDDGVAPYALVGRTTESAGEVVVWSEADNQVLVAVDQNGPDGSRDGMVDHVFSFRTAQPLPDSLWLRDSAAVVREHGPQLTVVLRSHGQAFRFLLNGVRNVVSALEDAELPVRTFRGGIEIRRYSDSVLYQVDFEAVAVRGGSALSEGWEKVAIGPFRPPATGGGSGSCLSYCGIDASTCPGGSCTASCSTGYCAKCECIVGSYPDCRCGLK